MSADAAPNRAPPARPAAADPLPDDLPPALSCHLAAKRRTTPAARNVLIRVPDACSGFPPILRGGVAISRLLADGQEPTGYAVGIGERCVLTTSCQLGNARYNTHGDSDTEVELARLPR